MDGLYFGHFWFPEALASNWMRIPRRLGYKVDAIPLQIIRSYWTARIAAENQRRNNGFGHQEAQIPIELIESIVSCDRSALVVTGRIVIRVIVAQDILGIYDSTRSWWADIRVCFGEEIIAMGCDYSVQYEISHSKLIMDILTLSFFVSGAEWAYQHVDGDIMNVKWKRAPFRGEGYFRLFSCPQELAMQWPSKLGYSRLNFHLVPLCPTLYLGSPEKYICGRVGHLFGGCWIYAGPALEKTTLKDDHFLAIKPAGWFLRRRLIDMLTESAIVNGAVRL